MLVASLFEAPKPRADKLTDPLFLPADPLDLGCAQPPSYCGFRSARRVAQPARFDYVPPPTKSFHAEQQPLPFDTACEAEFIRMITTPDHLRVGCWSRVPHPRRLYPLKDAPPAQQPAQLAQGPGMTELALARAAARTAASSRFREMAREQRDKPRDGADGLLSLRPRKPPTPRTPRARIAAARDARAKLQMQ